MKAIGEPVDMYKFEIENIPDFSNVNVEKAGEQIGRLRDSFFETFNNQFISKITDSLRKQNMLKS